MRNEKIQGFILYRIFYGDNMVYLGRTKQPLQERIRGHLFKKPMHRSLYIEHITKIEYAEFQTEADMNIYEIYFINLWKPPLNIDDKCKDNPTVTLPTVEWQQFKTSLWEKWKDELINRDDKYNMRKSEKKAKDETKRIMRRQWKNGAITREEYELFLDGLEEKENDNQEIFL